MEWTADDTNSFSRIHAGLPKGHGEARCRLRFYQSWQRALL